MNSAKKSEIRLTIEVSDPNANEAILLDYLRGDGKPRSYRDTILCALKAFWLPAALIQKGASDKIIYQATIDSLYALILQLKYLEQKTGIHQPFDFHLMSQPERAKDNVDLTTSFSTKQEQGSIDNHPSTTEEVGSTNGSSVYPDLI